MQSIPEEAPRTLLDAVPPGLFRDAPVPAAVVDARSRRVIDANAPFAELLQRPLEEIRGLALDAVEDASGMEISEDLLMILALEDDAPRERTFLDPEGRPFPVEVRGAPLGPSHPTLVCLWARPLRAARDEELRQARLLARRWAVQKQEAIGRLAAGVASDLHRLLDVVMPAAEKLRERFEGTATSAELDRILDAGSRARERSVDLWTFSGRQSRAPAPLQVDGVIAELEELLEAALPADVALILRLTAPEAVVRADREQLKRLVVNLVLNARDAMPDGGYLVLGTKSVTVTGDELREPTEPPGARPGPHLQLSVSDSGVGMAEETRERIFEPFFTTRSGAAGLGLSTVYGIVRQTGGHLRVESRPGAGSTVRVLLPRIAEDAEVPPGPRAVGSPRGAADRRVLVVDPDPRLPGRAAKLLRELGYRVTECGAPGDALRIPVDAAGSTFDLLVASVVMPGMSGPRLAAHLRERAPDLAVVYLSGYHESISGATAREPGVGLVRPFTRDELAAAVERALAPRAAGSP